MIENFKRSKRSILGLRSLDETIDLHRDAHLICYVRFVDGEVMREELTFSADTTGESIFRMIDTFFKDSDINVQEFAQMELGLC